MPRASRKAFLDQQVQMYSDSSELNRVTLRSTQNPKKPLLFFDLSLEKRYRGQMVAIRS
jgi:hypothetical protein